MKRSNQLIVESLVIASILLGVLFAGTVSTSSLPKVWVSIQNPNAVQPNYNFTSIAVYYSDTLTSLSSYQYKAVSDSLNAFQFLVVPTALTTIAQNANVELASINDSLPAAQLYLNETESYYFAGALANATKAVNSLCSNIQDANASLYEFSGPSTSELNNQSVPTNLYNHPVQVLQNEISSYIYSCQSFSSKLTNSGTILTLTSDQNQRTPYGNLWAYTGGAFNLTTSIQRNDIGIPNQVITFHVGGQDTNPVNLTTDSTGSISGLVYIPFVYTSYVSVWATAATNTTSGVPSLISNVLNVTILYNETQIIIQDPPNILPTFPFTVSGVLRDNSSGSVLPEAPVRITSFGTNYYTKTNSAGVFTDILTVPANATDGLHDIYAAFAPQGAFGPSANFTSIVVYRLPVNLTINPPGIVFPGFPSSLSGTVKEANGSALSNSLVELNTQWGIFSATSDSSGKFTVPFAIPLDEFSLSGKGSVAVFPSEPYFLSAGSIIELSLINLEFIVIVACISTLGFFGARRLGIRVPIISRLKKYNADQKTVGQVHSVLETVAVPSVVAKSEKKRSKVVSIYLEALSLAAAKFNVKFEANMTIRETADLVVSKTDSGSSSFRSIALATEEYLYSKIPRQKLPEMEEWISKLKELWSS